MTKFLKIIKILQESLIRTSPSKNVQQPSKYLLFTDVEDQSQKRSKHRRGTIDKIQRSIWCLGSTLERPFLQEMPSTLTITRGLSSRYMIPPKMTKAGSKKTNEVTIIPAWMKKTKIKKFQDNMGNIKNKNQYISHNKNVHEFNVTGPKFKMTNLVHKKSKTIQLMTEPFKSKKFYKSVMNKIMVPHFETKHLVLKKKNNKKESPNLQSCLEDSIKDVSSTNIPENYNLAMDKSNKIEQERTTDPRESTENQNKQGEEFLMLGNIRNSPEPVVTVENNVDKSLVVVPHHQPQQTNKNDDRSRIRRQKTKNVIAEKDEKSLKLKAKHFEKPEVDKFIKKLAAKYGKILVQKSSKPKRIYENNRQRTIYDLNTEKHLINEVKEGPLTKHVRKIGIETKISNYPQKKLNEFLKKGLENNRILKKGNNHLVNQRMTSRSIDEKPKKSTILRKEDLTAYKKIKTEVQSINKKTTSAIKLNSKNGLLKTRNTHVRLAEKENTKLETESSLNFENVIYDRNDNKCANRHRMKNVCCQNKKKVFNDQVIPEVPKNIGNSLIIATSDNNELQKEVVPSNDVKYESSTNVKRFTEFKKNDDESQTLLNNPNNKTELMISDILSNKRKEYQLKIDSIARESKDKQVDTNNMEKQTTEPPENKKMDKDQHVASKVDMNDKPIEQMKYMKYSPHSPNHICSPKQRIVSCKYKISRGVHSDKPHISRESKRHLRNAQPDFKLNNEVSLKNQSDNSKTTNKEEETKHLNKILPSKEKIMDKTILLPMKLYKFHRYSESLDYKVYKYDNSPSIFLEIKQSNNTDKPNKNNIQTGMFEQINSFKRSEHNCLESRKIPIDVKKEKLIDENTIRVSSKPTINFGNAEWTTVKEIVSITTKQPINNSVRSTCGENLPMILSRVLPSDIKEETFNSRYQSKPKSEVSRQIKLENVIPQEVVEDKINSERKENTNIIFDKEISNCATYKNTGLTINLKKQIKDEDTNAIFGAREGTHFVNDNKTFLPLETKEINNPEGYNLDFSKYSRRELKNILPLLKNLPNNTMNIGLKVDTNVKPTESKEEPAEKEKTIFIEKDATICSLKIQNNFMPFISAIKNKSGLNNKHYNPNIVCTSYSEGHSKEEDINAPDKEKTIFIEKDATICSLKIPNKNNFMPFISAIKNKSGLNNKHYNPNIFCTSYSEGHSKEEDINAPDKEKTIFIEKDTTVCSLKIPNKNNFKPFISAIKNKSGLNNKHYNPNICCTSYSEGHSKQEDLNPPSKETLKLKMHKNNLLEDMQLINKADSKPSFAPSRQQLAEICQQGRFRERDMWDCNIKKEKIFPMFDDKNKIGMVDFFYDNPMHEQKLQKSTSEMGKFHELVINNDILNRKAKKNIFLMHGFNKVSFLKVFEDNHGVTYPKIAINTNSNEGELPKNKANELKVLENDLKTMLGQHRELYNRKINLTYPKKMKKHEKFKIYIDFLDFTHILEHFNNNFLIKNPPKNLTEENLGTSSTLSNDFVLINGKTEKNGNDIVPTKSETDKDYYNILKEMKTCERLIVKHNPKDVSIIEVLDCKIPMKCTKTNVKESSTDEIGSKMFSFHNSKHMCFYSKYRVNCLGQNVIMKHEKVIVDQKPGKKNSSIVAKINIKPDYMDLTKVNYLESVPKSACQRMLISTKMLTFQEIYNYNHRKNVGIENKKNKVNEFSQVINKADKLYTQTGSKPNHSLSENSNQVKVEPEVLRYIKKLDKLPSNDSFKMLSNKTNTQRKNTNEAFLTTETIQEKYLCCNEPNEHTSAHYTDEVIKTGSSLINGISYSTEIKILGNSQDLSEFINECREGTFQYLTKVMKTHKMNTTNQSGTASSNINEKQEKFDQINIILNKDKKSSTQSSFPFPGSKMTKNKSISKNSYMTVTDSVLKEVIKTSDNNNSIGNHINNQMLEKDKELNMTSPNLNIISSNKNIDDANKLGINSNKNEANKLNFMNNTKEQEKQSFLQKKLENTLPQAKIETCDRTGDTNQITSNHKQLMANRKLKPVGIPIQTEVMPLANTGSMNKKHPHNDHFQNKKTDPSQKKNSFEDVCLKTDDLKTHKNIADNTTTTNIQNHNHSNRTRKKTHSPSGNTAIPNKVTEPVCKVHAVLNKKYTPRIQNGINNDTESKLLFTRGEVKNLATQKGSTNSEKMTENKMINEVNIETSNTSEVSKPITKDNKSDEPLPCTNNKADGNIIEDSTQVKDEQNYMKTTISNKINIINSNESYITDDSIPTGLRCIRQHKIDVDKDKCYIKKPCCAAESIKLKDRGGEHVKSPLRKEIGKSVTAKTNLCAQCGNTSILNQHVLRHKKQLETFTKDRRVKSIKNKLSNNLRPRDESNIINRQSHTLMSIINSESSKKKNEDRYTKRRKDESLDSQKNSINKIVSVSESKEQTELARNITGKTAGSEHLPNNFCFLDSSSNSIKKPTEFKKPSFNITCSDNYFKHCNEYKNDGLTKAENTELNFTQQETNVKKEKRNGTNNIGTTLPLNSFKIKQKKQITENQPYILKVQPKVEGFVSQTLRSSISQKNKIGISAVKKRQAGNLTKQKIKSELKQSAASLKKRISKHRIVKTDSRFKIDQKRKQSNLTLAKPSKMSFEKGLSLHISQKEDKKLSGNNLLDTPSRQVCGLTPPRQTPKEKTLMPKAKVTTKLVACTQQKDDDKNKFKVEKKVQSDRDYIFPLGKIQNMKPEKKYTSNFTNISEMDKGNTGLKNLSEFELKKAESENQKTNSEGTKELTSHIQQIIDKSKPAKLSAKVSAGNDTSNAILQDSFKGDISFPSIVGNVVNNVKNRIQNFLLADNDNSNSDREIISKKLKPEDNDDLKKKSGVINAPKNINLEQNELKKLNQTTEHIICCTNNQVQTHINTDKKKINSKHINRDASQKRKTISDLLTFKPEKNKQNCPQMSYSEVLNKFYAGCHT